MIYFSLLSQPEILDHVRDLVLVWALKGGGTVVLVEVSNETGIGAETSLTSNH